MCLQYFYAVGWAASLSYIFYARDSMTSQQRRQAGQTTLTWKVDRQFENKSEIYVMITVHYRTVSAVGITLYLRSMSSLV